MKKEYASHIKLSQLTLAPGPPAAGEAPADTGTPTTTGAGGANTTSKGSAAKASAPRPDVHARGTAAGAARLVADPDRIARRAQALREAAEVNSQARGEGAGKEGKRRHPGGRGLDRKKLILIAGGLGSLVLVGGLIALSARAPEPPPLSQPVAHAPRPDLAPVASPATAVIPSEDYPGRVQALKSAGNWNVLVIYAGEWSRKQPNNPEPWRELSAGYVKLHQFRDALDAATKAVEVAPEGFLSWQNLGLVNVALQQSAEALVAFDRAIALNDKDVISLVQTGMLHTQFGRYPDARLAFAKALAASPENVEALCGATLVAQKEGRLQDAEAMTGQLKAVNASCPVQGEVQSVRVVTVGPAKSKPDAQIRR